MACRIETPRLILREYQPGDRPALHAFLQNPRVMYAWEHGFSEQEADEWIARNLTRYQKDGYGHLAAVDRETGGIVGSIGLLSAEIEGTPCIEIGWILDEAYWGKGYAFEGGRACLQYAFETLGAKEVTADIRPENRSSRNVAERLGMRITGEFTKHYYGMEMPHLIYQKRREDFY